MAPWENSKVLRKTGMTLHADVAYGSQRAALPLLVIAGDGPSLLGWDWLMELRLDWQSIGLYRTEAAPPTTL
jgi:hypothetical protein